ncbi:hypothetical protein BP6252_13161 [Coleophoma cylindrospora]|uniref:Fungal N-terminal domain-containing protein n=1 Tax=Coleophoma cylindrospora TaxID=1849047 RepID=A0A3D8QA21_9HELO|nr:hypothetical protein BP6252_13161 [Coleophoma cylindrospora]
MRDLLALSTIAILRLQPTIAALGLILDWTHSARNIVLASDIHHKEEVATTYASLSENVDNLYKEVSKLNADIRYTTRVSKFQLYSSLTAMQILSNDSDMKVTLN